MFLQLLNFLGCVFCVWCVALIFEIGILKIKFKSINMCAKLCRLDRRMGGGHKGGRLYAPQAGEAEIGDGDDQAEGVRVRGGVETENW
jgi:hypothetical protein